MGSWCRNLLWDFYKKIHWSFFLRIKSIVYISFNKSVPTLLKEFNSCLNEKFHIIDCFISGKGKNDATFLRNYEEISKKIDVIKVSNPSNLDELTKAIATIETKISSQIAYIFDSLTGMQNLVKDESLTYSFFYIYVSKTFWPWQRCLLDFRKRCP